jgi:hypothetical protein
MRDQENALEVRLAVAAAGAVALLVPFAVITAMVVGGVGWLHRVDLDVSVAVHVFSAASGVSCSIRGRGGRRRSVWWCGSPAGVPVRLPGGWRSR